MNFQYPRVLTPVEAELRFQSMANLLPNLLGASLLLIALA